MKNTTIAVAFCVILLSCETELGPQPPPPPSPTPTIALTVEDIGVTESWLRVSIPDTVVERTLSLYRDGEVRFNTLLMTNDSVLVDEGLLPNQQYSYQAFRTSGSEILDSTEIVQATTMDTTSHEFVWEMFEFGDHSSSILYDVAILDENNIWAVGEIYLDDSTGQVDPRPYNIARWDGSEWILQRMPVPIFCGSTTWPSTATSILAFNSSDIWISADITVMRWDGGSYAALCIPQTVATGTIRNLWGETPDAVYAVGDVGTIAYYNGAAWLKIESGTILDVIDIYGAANHPTGETEIIAVASRPFLSFDRKILRITGTTVEMLSDIGIPGSLKGIWFKSERKYYVAGDGMFSKRWIDTDDPWIDVNAATSFYLHRIRGRDINDVVVCGSFGDVAHYNGVAWRNYRSSTGLPVGEYYGVAIEENIVVAVGFDQSRAVIARGVRATQP